MPHILLLTVLLVATPTSGIAQELAGDGSLPATIAEDFARFFTSADTYTVLGVGLGASAALSPFDHRIASSRFNGDLPQSPPSIDRAFEAGELLGGGIVQMGGAFLTYGIGQFASKSEMAALGRDLVRAQIVTAGVTQLLKNSIRRERPDGSSRTSYPSGHSSGTFATATVFQRRYGWKAGLPAFGVAAYVAASRLSENRHYLSDVIFGAAIGLAGGRAVTFERGDTRFRVGPAALAGGAGIQMTVVGW